jgi:hypothetical protein
MGDVQALLSVESLKVIDPKKYLNAEAHPLVSPG